MALEAQPAGVGQVAGELCQPTSPTTVSHSYFGATDTVNIRNVLFKIVLG